MRVASSDMREYTTHERDLELDCTTRQQSARRAHIGSMDHGAHTCIHIHNTFPFILRFTCRRSRTLTTALARIQRATLKAFAVPRPALRTLFTQNVECCIWRLNSKAAVTPAIGIAATALAPMLLFPRSSSPARCHVGHRATAQRSAEDDGANASTALFF